MPDMKRAGNAHKIGLYRHLRTFENLSENVRMIYRIKIASSTSQYLLITNENEDSFYDKHVNYFLYDIQKNSYVPLSLPFKIVLIFHSMNMKEKTK